MNGLEKKNARGQRDFNLDKKRFGDGGSDQTLARLEILPEWSHHEPENRVGEQITQPGGDNDSDQ